MSLDETREGFREEERDRVPMAEAKKNREIWGNVDLIKQTPPSEEERNTRVNDPTRNLTGSIPGRVIILNWTT